MITTWTMMLAASRFAAMAFTVLPAECDVVPAKVRVLLGAGLGFCFAGAGQFAAQSADGVAVMTMALITNIAIGAMIGLTARLVFAGVAMGGELIAQQIGIGLADSMNPQSSIGGLAVRRLCVMVALSVFVISGGLTTLIKTASELPLAAQVGKSLFVGLVEGGRAMFMLAVNLAGPVILAMFCVTLAVGMIQRTMPGVNVLSVGVSLRVVIGLIFLAGLIAALPAIINGGLSGITRLFSEGLQ